MFTIDGKEHDEKKISDKGKVAFSQLQQIAQRKMQLTIEFQNQEVLQKHYGAILKEELPEDEKKKMSDACC
jgi:hypothetical protein